MATISKISTHLKRGENLKILLKRDNDDHHIVGKKCSIQITNVSDCKLYEIDHYYNSICTEEFGLPVVNFKIDLEEGIYAIAGFSNCIEDELFHNSIYQDFMPSFQIYKDSKMDLHKIRSICNKAIADYLNLQKEGLGNKETSTSKYSCYAFGLDVYIGKDIKLGIATITPINRLDNMYLKTFMSESLKEKGIVFNYPFSQKKKTLDDPYNQPSVLIEIHNVYASSVDEASQISNEYCKKLIYTLSMMNNSHGVLIGDAILDKKTKQISSRSLYFSYLGNVFVGFESPKRIKEILSNTCNSEIKEFYSRLYHEAMVERDRDLKRFKLWNILESVARNKDYIGNPLRRLNGEYVKNKRGKKLKINGEAINLVRELLRNYILKSEKEIMVAKHLEFGPLEDRLKIWYQRRNCVAHRGKCIYKQEEYCNSRDVKMEMCRVVELKLHKSKKEAVDEYLFSLKNLVREVLEYEIVIMI